MTQQLLSMFGNNGTRIAAAVLILQIFAFYALAGKDKVLPDARLAEVPHSMNGWQQVGGDAPLDQEVMDLLRADQVLNRVYVDPGRSTTASLFVAFFKSQRAGVSPHSPKVCLPGSGWTPRDSATIPVDVPGWDGPIPVNRYIVAKGHQRSLVLYWYQSHNRVVANEYKAKLYLMVDAMRYRRSDTSLVRIVIPVPEGGSEQEAERVAVRFAHDLFQPLRGYLPA